MVGVAEIGASIFQMSERRLEVISQNIANLRTPGYQSLKSFQIEVGEANSSAAGVFDHSNLASDIVQSFRDTHQGELKPVESSLAFALSGAGHFALRNPNVAEDVYNLTRNGAFQLSDAGYIVDALGWRLQNAEGRDLKIVSNTVKVEGDGTVFERGRPVDKIGVFVRPSEAQQFLTLPDAVSSSKFVVRQGMSETANVSLPDEMIEMMQTIRQAETGSRILQTYDTLMGRAISTFGQGQ